MTDRELTKAAVSIYRKACDDLEKLVKSQGVPVYSSWYGMRRQFKHNDNSQMVTSGRELLNDIETGRIGTGKGNMLVQATPEAVEKLKSKIIKDIVEECRRNISHASADIVKGESIIRELVKTGKISENQLRRIIKKERL